ncbi:hypothetical protein ACFLQN_01590 [Candidatus Aenigmatarchaeota archaeon]
MDNGVPTYVIAGIEFFRDEMLGYIQTAFSMPPEEGEEYLIRRLKEGTKELERADFYFGPNQPRGV